MKKFEEDKTSIKEVIENMTLNKIKLNICVLDCIDPQLYLSGMLGCLSFLMFE